MEVRFGNAALVDSVEALRAGQVVESNQECLDLFGLHASRETLGEWFDELPVTDQKWLQDLSAAVHAVGGGHKVRQIESSFTSVDGCNYQPRICAYRKREVDDVIESLDFMFTPVEESSYLAAMSPDLEALAICLDYAVRIRYQLLEPFMGRDLDQGDLQDFGRKYVSLLRQSLASRSLMEPKEIRQRLLTFFDGDERSGLEAILARSDEFWPPDDPNGGEMSTAIFSGDPVALQKLLAELASMNQTFLILASRKFPDVLARDVPRSAPVR
jgi:hypothetical protein